MIKFDRLFALLEKEGRSATNWLRSHGVHPSVVNKLRKNERVNTDTLDRVCRLLQCQPGDIMEFVEDKNETLDS